MAFDAIKKFFANLFGNFSVSTAIGKQLKNVAKIAATAIVVDKVGIDVTAQETVVAGSIFVVLDTLRNFLKTKLNIGWL